MPDQSTSLPMSEDLPNYHLLLPLEQSLYGPSYTHGYVHGHVHRHNDYMHIHGHIHNHDHGPTDANRTTLKQKVEPTVSCNEFDEMCRGIFCDELDDCYFEECRMGSGTTDEICDGHYEDFNEAECHHDQLVKADLFPHDDTNPKYPNHANSLCESQRSKLGMFEDLLQNVQKNVEELLQPSMSKSNSMSTKRLKTENQQKLQIHFPHPCHSGRVTQLQEPQFLSQVPSVASAWLVVPEKKYHQTHQTCFHAKVPSSSADPTVRDIDQASSGNLASNFDFVIQFDNFNQMIGLGQNELNGASLFNDDNLLYPQIEPTRYPCKWENCLRKVENTTLVQHLLDDHIKDEYDHKLNQPVPLSSFECEWGNCNYMDADYTLFLSHLTAHKAEPSIPLANESIGIKSNDEVAALLTPNSISEIQDSPRGETKQEQQNALNITSISISPKAQPVNASADTGYACNWQIGTDPTGAPILCGLVHSCEGELQHHLQDDHIGQGKSVYHCCWVGCDRHKGKPFTQRQKLYRHIHIHTQYKPCKCPVCGTSFAVQAILKQHMRIHSGEKPFICNTCGKTFSTSSSLCIHNRVHSGERPLQCPWPGCEKRFSESSNLAKHLRQHKKTFSCDVCGESFERKTELTKHKKAH